MGLDASAAHSGGSFCIIGAGYAERLYHRRHPGDFRSVIFSAYARQRSGILRRHVRSDADVYFLHDVLLRRKPHHRVSTARPRSDPPSGSRRGARFILRANVRRAPFSRSIGKRAK